MEYFKDSKSIEIPVYYKNLSYYYYKSGNIDKYFSNILLAAKK